MTRTYLLLPLSIAVAACTPVEESQDAGVDAGIPEDTCPGEHFAICAGECTNLDSDVDHCGACGAACPTGGTCFLGICLCPEGTVDCGDACAFTESNTDHCGACGNPCPENHRCSGGVCVEACEGGLSRCSGVCVDLQSDEENCLRCGNTCTGRRQCLEGICRCAPGQVSCTGICADLLTDEQYCGACDRSCSDGFECRGGECLCPEGQTECLGQCFDLQNDPNHCGACDAYCVPGQACIGGTCQTQCPPGWTKCGGDCVNPAIDPLNCGNCGITCGSTLSCINGTCQTCNSAVMDCDSDGWTVADGDCCDQPGPTCGAVPAKANPGALELPLNNWDDNCNGLVDKADFQDLAPCDAAVVSNSSNAVDFAKALGICRTTAENPPAHKDRTWGLIEAKLVQANGAPVADAQMHSLRTGFGASIVPLEGVSFAVLSSGKAADATQTNPGPNNGPAWTPSDSFGATADIGVCSLPYCIKDWFQAPNPPLKAANKLPEAPGCSAGFNNPEDANDSVMLVLRMRAPTNVRAFEFKGYFLSSEYPEWVCTNFNDHMVALVDTPGTTPIGYVNPIDKNLMTYFESGQYWPIGINIAKGTDLFKVCESQASNATCWDPDVSSLSCGAGKAALAGTGFEEPVPGNSCTQGGGTGWLVTSGNVRPGEIVELRIAIWDVGDHILDSLAILDAFKWLTTPVSPGTGEG